MSVEILIFLIIIGVLIVLLSLNSVFRDYIRQYKVDFKNLQKSLDDIKLKLRDLEQKDINIVKEKVKLEPEIQKVKETPPVSQAITVDKEKVIYSESTLNKEEEEGNAKLLKQAELEKQRRNEKVQAAIAAKIALQKQQAQQVKVEEKEPKKSFFDKYPDLEKFIGENLINKIGIVILILGLGFLVKYAIDKNWINEVGRVAIGILSAGALIGLAHKLRKDYKSFSSVLIGGGLALLYFTISLAFHTEGYPLYQQQATSFIILVVITIFAVFLAITYNRVEIAVLAIIGGFASPILLSNGSGNYIILFSYTMLLNVGMLVLSYFKKWRLVNIVAFILTVILFSLWLTSELFEENYTTFNGAILFATGFYIIFFLMNIIYNVKYNLKFKIGDISLLLSNTFIYFSLVMVMLYYISDGKYMGIFSILLALFNFAFAFYVNKRQKTDKTLLYLLIGLVFTFITLAIPLQLDGNYITLFWSVESVLLLWLSQKSDFKIMKTASFIVLVLMLVSIVMDWQNYDIIGYYSDGYVKELNLIFNKIFITTLVSVVSLVATFLLLKKEKDGKFISIKFYRLTVIALLVIVGFVGGILEVNYQAYHYFLEKTSQNVVLITYNALFILFLLLFAHKQNNKELSIITVFLSTLFIAIFLFSLSNDFAKSVLNVVRGEEMLTTPLLIFRWVSVFAVYAISFLLFKLFKKVNSFFTIDISKASMALLVITIIFTLSADLDAIGILIMKNTDVLAHTQKTGYAILWGVSSFLLMIIGMKRKRQSLRVFSLILFAITIIKLFAYDISEISDGGKIIAFIFLGILLLVISFMYQKLKKLISNDKND